MRFDRACAALFIAFLTACSAQVPAASSATSTPSASVSATASPRPSGWPVGGPVPSDLRGRWYQQPDRVLTFSANAFTFGQNSGEGSLVVNGSEIDFFADTGCMGPIAETIGRYTWTLSGTSVSFALLADPCAGRVGGTWTRTKP
jgi:hypothetical protein